MVIGCGPCGELRYPSYPEANGWRFPVSVRLWEAFSMFLLSVWGVAGEL